MYDTILKPGSAVLIQRVDAFGLQGREPHPPVNDDAQRTSPCDGQVAYVVEYAGWSTFSGKAANPDEPSGGPGVLRGWYTSADDAVSPMLDADAFALAPTGLNIDSDDAPTHFYRLVVPNLGTFEFATYELAGA